MTPSETENQSQTDRQIGRSKVHTIVKNWMAIV